MYIRTKIKKGLQTYIEQNIDRESENIFIDNNNSSRVFDN